MLDAQTPPLTSARRCRSHLALGAWHRHTTTYKLFGSGHFGFSEADFPSAYDVVLLLIG